MSANEMQVGGEHYKGTFQHWDFAAQLGLGYFLGQATKYLSRWRRKNGKQDLKKARHFLVKLIEEERSRSKVFAVLQRELAVTYLLSEAECDIISKLVQFHQGSMFLLQDALSELSALIDREERGSEAATHQVNDEIDNLFATKEDLGGLK